MEKSVVSVVDLFCGGGGSGIGWNSQPGFRVAAAVDSNTAMISVYRKNVLSSALVANAVTDHHKITEYAVSSCGASPPGVLFMNPPVSISLASCMEYVQLLRPRVFFVVAAAKCFSGKWGRKSASAPTGYDAISFYLPQSTIGIPVDIPLGVLMGVSTDTTASVSEARWLMQQVEVAFRNKVSSSYEPVHSVADVLGDGMGGLAHYFMPPRGAKQAAGVFRSDTMCQGVRVGVHPGAGYVRKPADSAPLDEALVLTLPHALVIKGLPGWFNVAGSPTFQNKVIQCVLSPRVCEVLAAVTTKVFSFEDFSKNSADQATPRRTTGILLCPTLPFHWASDGVSPDPDGEISVVSKREEAGAVPLVPQEEEKSADTPWFTGTPPPSPESVGGSSYSSSIFSATGLKRKRGGRIDALLQGCSQNMRDHFSVSLEDKKRGLHYKVGTHKSCDRRLRDLLGFYVPPEWGVCIKESGKGDTLALHSADGRTFRSVKKAKMTCCK